MPDAPKGYRAVKADLLARIRAGEWAPGARIPDEIDLAGAFGCARATVNRALRELAEDGVVERRRKAGTFVAENRARPARVEIPLIDREIAAQGRAYGYRLLARQEAVPPPEIAGRLELRREETALHVLCLHLGDGVPWQLEDRWINLATVPVAREAAFDAIGPNAWLVREIPFTDAEHAFGAQNAGAAEAAHLGILPGDALFVVERRTWLQGRVVTFVRLMRPGKNYRLYARGP